MNRVDEAFSCEDAWEVVKVLALSYTVGGYEVGTCGIRVILSTCLRKIAFGVHGV